MIALRALGFASLLGGFVVWTMKNQDMTKADAKRPQNTRTTRNSSASST
jgi:uncharacterized Tic20 family protein